MYSVATNSTHKIIIGGLVTRIARLVKFESDPDDRVADSKRLNLAAFEQMKFFMVDGGCIHWIYPGD